MKHPVRVLSLAAAVALATAGCSAVNPITTQQAYDASDGMSVEVGDVKGLNLLVITEGEGEPAVLIGSLHNYGEEPIEVSVGLGTGEAVAVEVPAGTSVQLGGEEDETHVTGTSSAAPGGLQDVVLMSEQAGTITETVPVLDGTLPEYEPELDSL
ncbi:hypothetical protein [Demequina phytophila]|uniref:hypothetical protein n=1 Tax=Demequina phytophila TaxID=1638981 RepID=UPI00078351AD|nr:hypothetical protein [Demequina phytophila]